jgi:hypothetical protein
MFCQLCGDIDYFCTIGISNAEHLAKTKSCGECGGDVASVPGAADK